MSAWKNPSLFNMSLFLSYGLGEFVAKGLNVLLPLTLPFIISQDEYGHVALLMSFETLLFVVLSGGSEQAFLRLYARFKNYPNKFILSALRGWTTYSIAACLFLILAYLVAGQSNTKLSISFPIGMLFLIYSFLAAARNNFFSILRVEENISMYMRFKIIAQIVKFGVTLGLAFIIGGSESYIFGCFVSVCVGFVILFPYLKSRLVHSSYSAIIGNKVRAFGLPLLFTSLSGVVMSSTDVYMLAWLHYPKDVGIYSFVTSFAGTNFFFLNILTLTLLPGFFAFKTFSFEAKSYLKKMTILGFLVVLTSSAVLFPAYLYITSTYLPEYSARPVVFLLASARFCLMPLYLYGNYIVLFHNRSLLVPFPTAIACVLNVILNYFFIDQMGIFGAALATLLSEATHVVLMWMVACYALGSIPSDSNIPDSMLTEADLAEGPRN